MILVKQGLMMYRQENIREIYDAEYAAGYEGFYLHPWPRKHDVNLLNVRRILNSVKEESPRWLDLGCGQAWHFTHFPGSIRKVGVDLSIPQLKLAGRKNPDALFVQADISELCFPDRSFDLVTCFWAAYCYLDSQEKIAGLVKKAVTWARPGGAMYFEVLLPEDLRTFNQSEYSVRTGFRVYPRTPDFVKWGYRDKGGEHCMSSPPLHVFTDLLAPRFSHLEAQHDGGFMTHVIALARRDLPYDRVKFPSVL